MTRRFTPFLLLPAGLLIAGLLPRPVSAQIVNGSAEWTVANNVTTTNTQSNGNGAFWQDYNLAYGSKLWDERLVKYNGELMFRNSSLSATTSGRDTERGHQNDLGYRLGTSLFSASAFPVFFQMSRVHNASSGELGQSSGLRSGIALPSATASPGFDTENRALNVGAQLNLPRLPRADLTYRTGDQTVRGGPYRAEQHDGDLGASLAKDDSRFHHALRYQRSSFDHALAGQFVQRLGTLDYDFGANLGTRTRIVARSGRRTSYVRSETVAVADTATAAYAPPITEGAAGTAYATAGLNYEPTPRLSLRLSGDLEQQKASEAATRASLGMLAAHVEVVHGLTLNANSLAGTRGQTVNGVRTSVVTRSGDAGLAYQTSVRWLSGGAGISRGMGLSTTPDGRQGTTASWSREASLSTTVGWFGAGAGYERTSSQDEILDFGNYDSERLRSMAQVQNAHVSVTASADSVRVTRGVGQTFARNRQQTFSGTASLRLWRGSLASGTFGRFFDDYAGFVGEGRDTTLFWTAGVQATPRPSLRVAASLRREEAAAARTHLSQRGFGGEARIEWRLRALKFGLEYRDNSSQLQWGDMSNPDVFTGRQFRFSIARQFGFAL